MSCTQSPQFVHGFKLPETETLLVKDVQVVSEPGTSVCSMTNVVLKVHPAHYAMHNANWRFHARIRSRNAKHENEGRHHQGLRTHHYGPGFLYFIAKSTRQWFHSSSPYICSTRTSASTPCLPMCSLALQARPHVCAV